jgi:hypothetical protein
LFSIRNTIVREHITVLKAEKDWKVSEFRLFILGVRATCFFVPVQSGPGAHPASCTMGAGSFPGVKPSGCGASHTPPPLLVPRVTKGYSYTSTPPGLEWPVLGPFYLR